MQHLPALIFGASAGLLVLAGLGSALLSRRRIRRCLEEAAALGFSPVADAGWASVFSLPHPLFRRGRGGAVRWCAERLDGGLPARLLDYEYARGAGRRGEGATYAQTVAVFRIAGAAMPAFQMHPERWYHALADLVGQGDIDFPGFEAFNGAYRLRGRGEGAIRAFFRPAMLSALGRLPNWSVEGAGETLLVYHHAKTVSPDGLRGFLSDAREVAEVFRLR